MAYDETLAERIRQALTGTRGVTERRMFGGICFMLGGNMTCGLVGDTLMLRVGPEAYESCLALPHVREMDFTGRPLRGYIYVAPAGLKTDRNLASWLDRALRFARTLPVKQSKAPTKLKSGSPKKHR